jgi:hypothetical protein
MKPEVSIQVAVAGDAAEIARLLHDFNTEFSEPSPGVERLADTVAGPIARGEATVLLAGEGPDGLAVLRLRTAIWSAGPEARSLYESSGFSNREGSPDGPSMLFYEREL